MPSLRKIGAALAHLRKRLPHLAAVMEDASDTTRRLANNAGHRVIAEAALKKVPEEKWALEMLSTAEAFDDAAAKKRLAEAESAVRKTLGALKVAAAYAVANDLGCTVLLVLSRGIEKKDDRLVNSSVGEALTTVDYLRMHAQSAKPAETHQYVTLDQAAAMVQRSKRTLEHDPLPEPDIEGGGGKPNEWAWSTIRPWLQRMFGRLLPDRLPSKRN
jgi:hypothetical protein